MALRAPLPSGTVTLLFTDMEGSTQHWEEQRAAMPAALRRHDELLRTAIEAHGGYVFKTWGDQFCAAFSHASDAIASAADAQRALAAQDWSAVGGLAVRMALHSGTTDEREGDYFGPAVNRVARLLATAHGGQVVFSSATALLLRGLMPEHSELCDLGEHRLADLAEPEHVWQIIAPGLVQTFPPLRSLESMPNNLPRQLTPLIGRDGVLAEIERLLHEHALVTLVGTGGVGKTRVALQAGADLLNAGRGVWFVELARANDTSLVGSTIASTLGLREQPERPVLETVLRYLKQKRLLLILDNCEHVIEELARVADAILRSSPDVRLLVTSREPLRIGGERVYRIPSLAFPLQRDTLTAEDALRYGAVALFAQRAEASDANFKLTDETAPIVAEICWRLDGIALAIELAAARAKVLALRQLAQKLDERFRVLIGGSRTALPRHQTMRALIDWSHDLLSPKEQKLFRRLAIFAGGWSIETAGAVCTDDEATKDAIESWEVLDVLGSLVDKSLVHAEAVGNEMRYRLLESTRQYARERLAAAGEDAALARAHALAFLALGEDLNAIFETTPEREWLARAEPELENFRAALTWAFEAQGDVPLGQRLTAALRPAWTRFAAAEGQRRIRAARTLSVMQTPATVEAALDLAEAAIATALSQRKTARERSERALALYSELGDPLRVAQARHLLGRAHVDLEEPEAGETILTAALNEARAFGLHSLTGDILQSLAIARNNVGDVAGARALFAEALAMFHSVGAERVISHIAGNLAEAEFHGGNAVEALRLENEALATYRSFNHKLGAAIALSNIAAYLIALERYEDAWISARDGLAAARNAQWEAGVAWGLQHLAAIAVLRSPGEAEHGGGDRLLAARLLGYVDERLHSIEALRQYTEHQEHDKMLPKLRDALGEDQLAKLMAEGATWTEDQAVAEALAI
ncbi:MAG TPA: adenylate/guanylate cyclase domain-containing protein [Candidatus Cybelea sp.]|jgi:predicted ATPase/class 3 adenylate cyclase|nr:adenylate/guanylate cyclase domain-containing protein [Candidatus Cybelea sp.]